ncbi:hypothetical protein [Actinoplanes sp. N902-109]|uniref:hypothetical protein n=1 Tax=Actinoplanes sp. (strain N902-109) TaxID=649831 RepID=UPI0018DBF251|nr:hypothetical protein [Actinoplanes sp. N902-109]
MTLGAGVALVAPALPAAAAEPGVITSAGPLSRIATTAELNCAVNHVGDTSPEFYGATACGTLIAVGGVLFGPADIPAGGSAAPRTAFTPVSQTGPTGNGSAADPYRVVTVVDLGSTGIRLTQTDLYVAGQERYSTSVELRNTGGSALDAIVYRAGDCYLANSDVGLGKQQDNWIACATAAGRVEQWVPLTAGSRYYEAGFDEVWRHIGTQQPFPNTCRCNDNIDNGAGLSWSVHVPAAGTARVSHLTAFASERDNNDRDGDGLLDSWETSGLDLNGDGTPEVDLPAMGASPDHKDVFVEVDWMNRPPTCIWVICWGGRSFAPQADALADVRASFANAPVGNPDGTTGVRAHIDNGPASVMNPVNGATWGSRSRANQVPHTASLGTIVSGDYQWAQFDALKNANFEASRADVFHYALFADTYAGSGSSGIARGLPGDSFLVTDGHPSWGSGFTRRQEAGTFMHELGHTLSLHHGGGGSDPGRDLHYKPNYLSIMNYSWQLGGRALDYSRSVLPTLDENALSEPAGLGASNPVVKRFCPGGGSVVAAAGANTDWNCNGTIDSGTVAGSVNNDSTRSVLQGYEDWSHLVYDGGAVGAFGIDDLDDQSPPPATTPADEPTAAELRAAQSFGGAGDGSVGLPGPTVLFRGVAGQRVPVDVTNVGNTSATYRLVVTLGSRTLADEAVTVGAGATRRLEYPVDAATLALGTVQLTAKLGNLSTATADITVPDLSTAANREAATDAANRLSTSQPGLEDSLRTQVLAAVRTAVEQTVPTTPPPTPGPCTITGTEGNDVLTGTPGPDVICGKGGDDIIRGLGGDDRILGGFGRDTISGGDGNDSIDGADANDTITGDAGNDTIVGGYGDDTISGGTGDDTIDGADANDVISGDAGRDTIVGGYGDDRISGGEDDDTIDGRDGKDVIAGDGGNDTITAGVGDDQVTGGLGNDTVSGGSGRDTIAGDDGDDILNGDGDADRLSGGPGNDHLTGGAGTDVLDGGSGTNVLIQ